MPHLNGFWVAGNFRDFTGQKVHRWTVIEFAGNAHWLCRCDCGTVRKVASSGLLKGTSRSCGCLRREELVSRHATAPRYADLVGRRFDRLTAIERVADLSSNKPSTRWRCRCDCGKEKVIKSTYLLKGVIKSCGCLCNERKFRKHGLWKAREYGVWCAAKTRCHGDCAVPAANYAARQIWMCQRWRNSFADFIADMGRAPAGHTLDRIDNDGGYTCGKCDECQQRGATANCRWATMKEQLRNTRRNHQITFNGTTKCLTAWAEEVGLKPITLYNRLIKMGWPVDKALTTPVVPKSAPRKNA